MISVVEARLFRYLTLHGGLFCLLLCAGPIRLTAAENHWVYCESLSPNDNTAYYSDVFEVEFEQYADLIKVKTAFMRFLNAHYDIHGVPSANCVDARGEQRRSNAEADRDTDVKRERDRGWKIVVTDWKY